MFSEGISVFSSVQRDPEGVAWFKGELFSIKPLKVRFKPSTGNLLIPPSERFSFSFKCYVRVNRLKTDRKITSACPGGCRGRCSMSQF